MKQTLYELGDRQRAILECIWRLGPSTVAEVRDAICPDHHLAYTSILSTMQKLESFGWLSHDRDGRRYRFDVTATRRDAVLSATRAFVRRLDADPAVAASELLDPRAPHTPRPSLRDQVDLAKFVR